MKLPLIIAMILAIWAICTRAEDHPVLINEVATIGEQFIELKKKDVGVLSLENYGIIILEKDFRNKFKNLKITAALDLSGLTFIFPYQQIIHFGNMKYDNMMEKPPPQPKWRIFENSNANTWLQIKENNFISIFLTKGNKNVLEEVKANSRSNSLHVTNDIMKYLKENVVDYVSIRKFNGPIHDKYIDEILQFKAPQDDRQSLRYEFVTEFANDMFSQSKCGVFIPFDLGGFKVAHRSPTTENICNDLQQKYVASDHIADDLDMLNVRDELFGENSNLAENILATGISENEANADIAENLDLQNPAACVAESELSQRMGLNEMEVTMILQMKRKIRNDPTFNDLPWLRSHPDFPKWIAMIKEHQAHILPIELIKKIGYVTS